MTDSPLFREPLRMRYWAFRAWLWRLTRDPYGFNPWRVKRAEWQAAHGQTLPAEEVFRRLRHKLTTSRGDTDGNPLP